MKSTKKLVASSLIVTLILVSLGGVNKAIATPTYGNATVANILSGKTATVDAGQITGTMPNLGSEEYAGWRRAEVLYHSDPGRVHLRIPLGAYVNGTPTQGGLMGIFSDDPNFIPSNLLSGKSYFGMAGTMPNMATANPNGIGVGRSSALQWWTGGGTGIYFKPQPGYYDGIDTWTAYNEPNLVPSNIKSGTSILGVAGTTPYFTYGASDSVIYSNSASRTVTVPTTVREVITNFAGALRVKFTAASSGGSTYYSFAQIYKNGVAVGSTVWIGNSATFSVDVYGVVVGDHISMVLWKDQSASATITAFSICGTPSTTSPLITVVN